MTLCADSPTVLSLGYQSPEETVGTWWAASLRASRGSFHVESRYAAELARREISHYIPSERVRRVRNGATQEIKRPLFRGYAFVAVQNDDERMLAKQATSFCHVEMIRVPGQRELARELTDFWTAEKGGLLVECFAGFQPGRKVEVVSGPFRGMQAHIDKRDDRKAMVTLAITMLGRSTPVEISPEYLELA